MHDTSCDATYDLKHKSDREVMVALSGLVRRDQQLCAELLAHLAEVDERRLYLAEAAPSLFVYCVQRLNLSEDAAYKRIAAYRAARRFPIIFSLVAQGELHLSAINLLAPHLTDDNYRELCLAARSKSKRQVEELLVARFPSPDVKTTLRKLPAPRMETLALTLAAPSGAQTALAAAASVFLPNESPADTGKSPPRKEPPAPERPLLAPLASERYRLQLTLSGSTRDKLLRAQELLLHSKSSGDLAAVVDLALSTLIETLERRKFGKTKRQKEASLASSSLSPANSDQAASLEQAPGRHSPEVLPTAAAQASPLVAHNEQLAPRDAETKRSRYIPRAVRRLVAERDNYQCAFVAADGTKCSSRGRLEYHHRTPYARGGEATVDGLELRCAGHNRQKAELDFGEKAVRAAIALRQGKRSPSAAPLGGRPSSNPHT
jgi:5-methylcytosine-specific restriction endonuclease McrA